MNQFPYITPYVNEIFARQRKQWDFIILRPLIASIFVMLDEFRRTTTLRLGQRILLFVPESGQFNFVLIRLTVVSL